MKTIIKKRQDYKPLYWLANETLLEILIYDKFTIVKSNISFKKNDDYILKSFKLDSNLELNGENLITKKFQVIIDKKKQINYEIQKLKKINEVLSIPIPSKSSSVNIIAEVKIFPINNTSLEGLYQTNNMLCTQCEPEGFRKITWFPDRPDCLSLFKVKIEASNKFNTILSNGNLIREGVTTNKKRLFKVWHDPFPKPSYLFALVVGNLECTNSTFVTLSKKKIDLKIFTEIGNKHLTKYAMQSLKKAMKWDEKKYKLEYDLNTFMIVAVSHFNMGAMENKGLNIFNSKFVLADKITATDKDLQNIESIVAHEYFHNWTGNRITCRDWFQLTLKEGLTVFRDQNFSADMNNKGVKRIEDVLLLRSTQFVEDAGSNNHPIRPDSYIEINNFYTPTVYEKGAEVIRMIYNYLGEQFYKNGMDLYFKKFDGEAITCENFLEALEEGSKVDLKIFERWYSTAGTPYLKMTRKVNNLGFEINFSQKTLNKNSNLPIPIKMAFLDRKGSLVKFKINNSKFRNEHVYLLSKTSEKVKINCNETKVTPSILRGFSAPVILNSDLNINEYIHLLKFDNDEFNKWDAAQSLYLNIFSNGSNLNLLTDTLGELLQQESINSSLMALLLELPSRSTFENLFKIVDPIIIFNKKNNLIKKITRNLRQIFEQKTFKLCENDISNPKNIGDRSLLEKLLKFLVSIESKIGIEYAKKISKSENMTLSIIGLKSLCFSNQEISLKYLDEFYTKWENNDLVIQKWLEMMSTLNIKNIGLNLIKDLLNHKAFDYKYPNKVRSVLNTFQRENVLLFHANNASGYNFISEEIFKVDKINPQIAARLILPLTRFNKYKTNRKNKIIKALKNIEKNKISSDLSEIIQKALQYN